jgi:hypothetical protein
MFQSYRPDSSGDSASGTFFAASRSLHLHWTKYSWCKPEEDRGG